MKYSLIFLLFIILFQTLVGVKSVQAQETTPIPQKEVVYQGQSLAKEIRQLTLQYRSELEEYRQLERQFQIAKKQYRQLETLASLEEAVRSTQNAMKSRDQVLHTYLRLLRLKLLSKTGIDLVQKKATEQELLNVLREVELHQGGLKENLDRVMLNQKANDFTIIAPQIEDIIYRVFSLIALGELETVYDQSILLKEDMYAQLATAGGALQNAQRQRSFAETERTLEQLKQNFDQLRAAVTAQENQDFKNVYRAINNKLFKAHAALARILAYLAELLTL